MNRIDKIEIEDSNLYLTYYRDNKCYTITYSIPIEIYDKDNHFKSKFLEDIDIVGFILFCLDDFRNNRESFKKELKKIKIKRQSDTRFSLTYTNKTLLIELTDQHLVHSVLLEQISVRVI